VSIQNNGTVSNSRAMSMGMQGLRKVVSAQKYWERGHLARSAPVGKMPALPVIPEFVMRSSHIRHQTRYP